MTQQNEKPGFKYISSQEKRKNQRLLQKLSYDIIGFKLS